MEWCPYEWLPKWIAWLKYSTQPRSETVGNYCRILCAPQLFDTVGSSPGPSAFEQINIRTFNCLSTYCWRVLCISLWSRVPFPSFGMNSFCVVSDSSEWLWSRISCGNFTGGFFDVYGIVDFNLVINQLRDKLKPYNCVTFFYRILRSLDKCSIRLNSKARIIATTWQKGEHLSSWTPAGVSLPKCFACFFRIWNVTHFVSIKGDNIATFEILFLWHVNQSCVVSVHGQITLLLYASHHPHNRLTVKIHRRFLRCEAKCVVALLSKCFVALKRIRIF